MSLNCDYCGKPNTAAGPMISNQPGTVHTCVECSFVVLATHISSKSIDMESVNKRLDEELKGMAERADAAKTEETVPGEA